MVLLRFGRLGISFSESEYPMFSYRYRIILLFALLLNGCSGGTGVTTVKASGVVIYKGQPVSEANVAFLGDGTIRPAIALTDEDGKFVLTTVRSGDGAVVGKHMVTVSKTVEPPTKAAATGSVSMEEAAKAAQETPAVAKTLYLVPEKYSLPATSGLTFDVKDGAENYFEIKLED
jgi:hypothetical protein